MGSIFYLPDDKYMMYLEVDPAFRTLLIASKLINSFDGELNLEVFEWNSNAINLYKKLGFEIIGERPYDYDEEPDTLLFMHRE